MTTPADVETIMAVYLGRDIVTDLVLNGVDTGLWALNAARRIAERARDLAYSETTTTLSVATAGTLITTAGTPIKRIKSVLLPVASSGLQPIEFLTYEQYIARVRLQLGRLAFDPTKTLAQLGVGFENAFAYQVGQTLYVYGATSYPITATLDIVQWLPDYVTGAETDFILTYGKEFLQWQGILECNKFWRRFIPQQEGNIDEKEVQGMADTALQAFLAWDSYIAGGTSTPPQPKE